MTATRPAPATPLAGATTLDPASLERASARFGVAFSVLQTVLLGVFAVVVLPHAGSPTDPPLARGRAVLEAASVYRPANYAFVVVGVLFLGFLGAVVRRLRTADPSGVLATIGVASGTLLAFVWPFAGVLHNLAIEVAAAGTDVRLLAGWDAIAPYCLAFVALPRAFFVGAVVLALRATGGPTWLVRWGVVALVLGVAGSATLLVGAAFPLLGLSTMLFELWVGALAWHWLRH